MFGMLDYRAHKLYLLLFGVPTFFIRWLAILGLPFLYYQLGLISANNRFIQVLVSVVAVLIIENIWMIVAHYIGKFFLFVFHLFVDVLPHDGRTAEEAQAVVLTGEKAIALIEFNKKHPSQWQDEDVKLYQGDFFGFFYKDEIAKRLRYVRDFYTENPDIVVSEWKVKEVLKNAGMEIGWVEKVLTTPQIRWTAITYLILFYLLIANPFH